MTRRAYTTDLRSLQKECASNFFRLERLLGDHDTGDERVIALADEYRHFGLLHVEVLERAPYTTMLRITQRGVLDHLMEVPRMRVHMYHDVSLAEVTDFQRQRHFEGRYRYPNPYMHQPDEKLQLNRFLGEWLTHALEHGMVVEAPSLG